MPAVSARLIDLRALTGFDPWRLFTGHLVHGSLTHLLLNLAFFMALGGLRERRVGTIRFLLEYALLAACVAVGVRLLHSGWSSYCGLSGVVYGTLVLVLLDHRRDANRKTHTPSLGAWVVGCISIKTTFELAGGGWVLGPGALEDSFGVLYLAGSHAAGIVGGLLLALVARSSARRFPAQEKRPDSNGRVRNVEDRPDHCSSGSTRAPQPPRVLRSHSSEGVNG